MCDKNMLACTAVYVRAALAAYSARRSFADLYCMLAAQLLSMFSMGQS
jgi:hypothetical protein